MDQKILDILNSTPQPQWPTSWALYKQLSADHTEIVGALKSLESKDYLQLHQKSEGRFILNSEGEKYAKNGTPEFAILNHLVQCPEQTADKAEVEKAIGGAFKVGLQNGIKKLFVIKDKTKLAVVDNLDDSCKKDVDSDYLKMMLETDFFDGKFEELLGHPRHQAVKKRKLFEQKQLTYYTIEKGNSFSDKLKVLKADLTIEDMNSDLWKNKEDFKPLNLNARGKELSVGGLHPLMKLRTEFRNILLEMGFEEMQTNNFVESSFWNFDSLFQPQQHPARESHDTFFLKNPEISAYKNDEMNSYVRRVQEMHEKGYRDSEGESYGWKYNWSVEESQKNILRTHTTAVSSRNLKNIADEIKRTGVFTPRKLFSIDRVFRNETLDATHLAEFHQVEGLIIGKNLGLAQLKCFIRDFFAKIGITQLKFKPAYNPYTEPSMEIFVYHPLLKKTIEIGNSGVFRPEMLKPMGLPDDVMVIAWGLSLERPAMINFGCDNIRELVGHKVDIRSVKNAPIISFK